jgi:hypothetical protein
MVKPPSSYSIEKEPTWAESSRLEPSTRHRVSAHRIPSFISEAHCGTRCGQASEAADRALLRLGPSTLPETNRLAISEVAARVVTMFSM